MSLTGPILTDDQLNPDPLKLRPRLTPPGLSMPGAPLPVQMPDPHAPQYQPLRGLSALGPVLSQFAGIPTKSGLQPLEGVRQLGQRALEMPQERYQQDLKTAQTGLAMQDTEAQMRQRQAEADRAEAAANKPAKPDYQKLSPGEQLIDPANPGTPIASVPAKPAGVPEGDKPLTPAEIAQFNAGLTDRYQVLNPNKPLPTEFSLPANATQKDFDRIDKLLGGTEAAAGTEAQRRQTQQTAQQARDEKQSAKDEETVFAFNPKTKTREYLTRGEARVGGYTGIGKAVTEAEIDKEASTTRQFNDVQMNVSKYKMALDSIPKDIPKDHVERMTQIISILPSLEKSGGDGIISQLTAGILPTATSQAQQGDMARAWNYLTPEEREVMTGYFRARGSLLAYQKALTGTGRSSQLGLQLEMPNLPEPYVGSSVADKRLKSFQENIDVASKGLVRFPWLDQPEDIRKSIETKTAEEPARPANVPANYVFDANGRQGPGWYKPKPKT